VLSSYRRTRSSQTFGEAPGNLVTAAVIRSNAPP
jgi:hypothetical protein